MSEVFVFNLTIRDMLFYYLGNKPKLKYLHLFSYNWQKSWAPRYYKVCFHWSIAIKSCIFYLWRLYLIVFFCQVLSYLYRRLCQNNLDHLFCLIKCAYLANYLIVLSNNFVTMLKASKSIMPFFYYYGYWNVRISI